MADDEDVTVTLPLMDALLVCGVLRYDIDRFKAAGNSEAVESLERTFEKFWAACRRPPEERNAWTRIASNEDPCT